MVLPPTPLTHLLYLHGFRSSPHSVKAQWMAAWIARHRPGIHWACPQLPPSPAAARSTWEQLTANWPASTSGIIGSSLGGFYATILTEEHGWRSVVINPAVYPARDLAGHIGRQTHHHAPEQSFDFCVEYIDELQAMAPGPQLHYPERILALIAQGDEVLDWHEMAARYIHGPCKIIPNSDHGLSDFEQHMPEVLRHLGLL